MQVCSFRTMEKWHRVLMDQLQMPSQPGFRRPSMEQILRADRAAWTQMAEKVTSLKKKPDGSLPLNTALDELFHLMPLPMDRTIVQGKQQSDFKPDADGARAKANQSHHPRARCQLN